MDTGSERLNVHFAGDSPPLASGDVVKIQGTRFGSQIDADAAVVESHASASTCSPIGEHKIAIILIEFPGVPFPTSVVTPAELHEMYFSTTQMSLDAYWREASYGQTSASGDVFGPFKLDRNYDFFTQQPDGQQAAINAADSNVDFSIYNYVVVIWPLPGVSGWGGRATVSCLTLNSPSKGQIVGTETIMGIGTRQPYSSMVSIAAHEGGHTLGFNHASSLDFAPLVLGPPGTDGVHQEYGDRFSVMGAGEGGPIVAHYNAPEKSKVGWLDSSSILNVETDGSFVVKPLESTTGTRALRVRRGPGTDKWLWLEYRQPIGYDAGIAAVSSQPFSGALIHYEDPLLEPSHTYLLNFTPATPHDFSDPALAVGQIWSDAYSPLSIRIDSANPSGMGVSVSYRTPCTTLNPTGRNHGSGAETGTFAISAPAGCSWTAVSTADWIAVTAGATGTGTGTVTYAVQPNNTRAVRNSAVFVGFQAFTITQATSFVNQPASLDSVSPDSGAGLRQAFTFSLSDPNGASDLRNIDVVFGGESDGFICQVSYNMGNRGLSLVTPTSPTTLSVVGPYVLGTNAALQNNHCGVDISAATATSSGNSMQLTLPMVFFRAQTWSIQANLYNLSGTLTYKRMGSWIAPANSCTYALGPTNFAAGKNDTAGAITVGADSRCPWLASTDSLWLKIVSPVSGIGGGVVSYTIAANTTLAPRSGTITIGGQTLSVSQSVTAGARPAIAASGAVNGASFLPGIAASTWVTIKGTNLAPLTRPWSGSDFVGNSLPTQLNGVSVRVNGKPAYVYYISPGQVNVLTPDDDFVGQVLIEVDTPDGRSDPIPAQKQPFAPGLFLFDQGGRKYAAAVYPDGVYAGPPGVIAGVTSRPAVPGNVVLLFGTGFGPVNPPSPAALLVGQPAPLASPLIVRIGDTVASVGFSGLVGPGLYQFNVIVPDIPMGDQPVAIEIGGARSQANAFVAVARSSGN
jgi:uncharacterized protein (TIGR03437 family)